ncbi:PTS sugar transporter subunit IIA [Amycolatopsis pigmentata]|uniref:Mannitol-specific phosphotransferase enzyme IIA component n=1 Tax=Amycolatopsis pigmentata TaxID=450801 RepID=A0ABW5G010_9PSEU
MSIDGSCRPVLRREGIRLGRVASGRHDAIGQCGRLLLELGAVEKPYLDAMYAREAETTTYLGEGVAIPHGIQAGRPYVRHTSLVVIQFPGGVDWDGHDVRLCVGIAAKDDRHLTILARLARLLADGGAAARLRDASEVATVASLLRAVAEEAGSPGL